MFYVTILGVLFLVCPFQWALAAQGVSKKQASPAAKSHPPPQKWLEQDAAYIITELERTAFQLRKRMRS